MNTQNLTQYEKNLNLSLVKHVQTINPYAIVGGSAALFLYGITFKRHEHTRSKDIDIIMPFYHNMQGTKSSTYISKQNIKRPSSNDFDHVFEAYYGGNLTLIDVRIDPHVAYNTIKYKGFEYKVCPLFDILEAKMRYAKNPQFPSGQKHLLDLMHVLKIDNSLIRQNQNSLENNNKESSYGC